jgi:hypothetical protein
MCELQHEHDRKQIVRLIRFSKNQAGGNAVTDKLVMIRDASLGVLLIGALSVVWVFDKGDPSDTRLAQNGNLLQPLTSDPKPKNTPRVPVDKKPTAKPKKASPSPQDSDDDGSGKTIPKTKVAVKPPKPDVDRDTVLKTPPTQPVTKPEPVVVGLRPTPKDEPTRKASPVRDAPKSVPEPKREVVRTILPEPDEKDDAVTRFIAYDIGRLSGIDGQRARTDFNQLGADSIPALIRGLNKSASISASCPVIVILSKLQSQLVAAADPQMYALAIANIGQGIASNAPHAHRLKSFRDGLMKHLPDDHPAKRRHQQVTTLMASRDRSAFLQASLSKDPMKRWAVASVAMQRRLPIGDQLIRLLSDTDEAVSHEARLALVSLSRQNYGPAPGASRGRCEMDQVVVTSISWQRFGEGLQIIEHPGSRCPQVRKRQSALVGDLGRPLAAPAIRDRTDRPAK